MRRIIGILAVAGLGLFTSACTPEQTAAINRWLTSGTSVNDPIEYHDEPVTVTCRDGSTFTYIGLPVGAETCADVVYCPDGAGHTFATGRLDAISRGFTDCV